MKRILGLALAILLLLTTAAALAETAEGAQTAVGVVIKLDKGAWVDLDEDGQAEQVAYEILTEDGYDVGYRLTIGQSEIVREGCAMDTDVYLLKLTEYTPAMVLVCDYGPSDDFVTYFHVYQEGSISYIGYIPSLAESMRIRDGVITASVRGGVLHTWYHDADFSIAHSSGIDYTSEDFFVPVEWAVYEIPRCLYPMGTIVTLKVDLPLLAGMNDPEQYALLPAGSKAILCATDDRKWVCIQSMEDAHVRGWMELSGESGFECVIGEATLWSDEVFNGLIFAD